MPLENFGQNLRSNTFAQRPADAAKYGGRHKSLKSRYDQIMNSDGGIMWIDKQDIRERKVKRKIGDKEIQVDQIGVKLSSRDKVIYKLSKIIDSSKDSTALNAIKFLFGIEKDDSKIKNQVNIQNNIESNSNPGDEDATYIITFFK